MEIQALELKEASLGLSQLELGSLRSNYNLQSALLRQISLKWWSKSRINWLQKGDQNTNFFHLSTIIRFKNNGIHTIEDDRGGSIIQDHNQIRGHFVDHYKKLWEVDPSSNIPLSDWPELPRISNEWHNSLITPISETEVRTCLFSMAQGKAPGPDGYTSEFYKNYWIVVAPLVMQAIHSFFNLGLMRQGWGSTSLVFIPKKPQPIKMNEFRPIALCNVLYKLLAKLLANKLRPTLTEIIDPSQSAFLPKKSIQDNILVAQELAHSINFGRKKHMLLKVDMDKAFDKISCTAIENALTLMNYP